MKNTPTHSRYTWHFVALLIGLLFGSQLNEGGWQDFKEGFARAHEHQMDSSR